MPIASLLSRRGRRAWLLGVGLAGGSYIGCLGPRGGAAQSNGDAGVGPAPSWSGDGSGGSTGSTGVTAPDARSSADSGPGSADSAARVDAPSSNGADVSASSPPSCASGGAGTTHCGSEGESCCASLGLAGGTFDRTYASSGEGEIEQRDPATVSAFRLDKYEVTVGRFRRFVDDWNGGAGYVPRAGSGKHAHLNGGSGLTNAGGDAAASYEMGWLGSDDGEIAPTDIHLACEPQFATWTPAAAGQETLPINCVNWYEAYAFCIWDGGFLPSEAEWESAAAGGAQQRQYPWGSAEPGTTNQYAIYGCHYPSESGTCTGGAAPVGTAALGAGLWGQLDLAGNVAEWNLDSYAAYGDSCADCAYLAAGSFRVLRGGYFYNNAPYLAAPSRSDDPPSVRSICIGVRCARGPRA